MEIQRFIPSPNFGERKDGARPEYVILHFTAVDDVGEVCQLLCDQEREVSAHYVLTQEGEIWQLVDEAARAWHAGQSFWAGKTDLNSRSIGIEIVNNGARPFLDAQYAVLVPMLRDISGRWGIPPENVIGHSDIAIGRKFDPGPWFNWQILDEAGVSAPPKAKHDPKQRNEAAFLEMASSAGYDANAPLEDLLLAIRIRHGATPFYGGLRDNDFDLIR